VVAEIKLLEFTKYKIILNGKKEMKIVTVHFIFIGRFHPFIGHEGL